MALEHKRILFSAEVLGSRLEYSSTVEDAVTGFHLTGGYNATDRLQFLIRLDHVESSELSQVQFPEPEDLILLGLNYGFTDSASFAMNYQLNPNDFDLNNQLLLAQMQIAF